MYEYRAQILRVVDGDTVHARVDLGFDVRFDMKLRLAGINAPEMKTPEGPPAKARLVELLGLAELGGAVSVVTIRTQKDKQEKYGRYLATLIMADGTDVNARMIAEGQAVPYRSNA